MSVTPVSRDAQLASSLFDQEISQLFAVQVAKGLNPFGSSLARDWKPEVDALLNGSLFYLSLGVGSGVTVGQELQNVRYSALSRSQKWALFGMLVACPYVWARLDEMSLRERWAEQEESSWKAWLYRWRSRIDRAMRVARSLNVIFFLWTGRYPRLPDRLARAGLEHISQRRGRAVAFDFMNRQLVWQGVTDFLLFFAPLIDFRRIEKLFRKAMVSTLVLRMFVP